MVRRAAGRSATTDCRPAAVAGLIWVGGDTMKFKGPLLEVFFTLVCGGCAVSILEAWR